MLAYEVNSWRSRHHVYERALHINEEVMLESFLFFSIIITSSLTFRLHVKRDHNTEISDQILGLDKASQ